ncbi:MAG: hypothetical protein WEA09_00580 [Gemmatimonadota bacterium]
MNRIQHAVRRLPAMSFVAFLLLAVGGCASGGGGMQGDPFAGGGGGEAGIYIVLENLAFNEATIDAVSNAGRARLGRVPGKGTQRLQLPWSTSVDLRLEISILAGRSFTTETITANPGDVLSYTIQETGRSGFRR